MLVSSAERNTSVYVNAEGVMAGLALEVKTVPKPRDPGSKTGRVSAFLPDKIPVIIQDIIALAESLINI